MEKRFGMKGADELNPVRGDDLTKMAGLAFLVYVGFVFTGTLVGISWMIGADVAWIVFNFQVVKGTGLFAMLMP